MLTHAELFLGIQKEVAELHLDMPIAVKGLKLPLDKEEWITFNDLSVYPMRSRTDTVNRRVSIEIICYAKHAQFRADGNFKRAWEMAEDYFNLLNQARMIIKSSCIQFREARLIYLDHKSLGDFAEHIDQQSPNLNLDAILLEVEGIWIQSKE
jgi:hypothetical protein